ncbi:MULTISPECIES: hypothetical protein [unclassified Thioalkalivibrio]|uniref:hypothetical protein n=1 Tax=unclassified Thioalkalivibrio TaxID=2621013 RepID=UPI001E549F50|nr:MULTISPECIES: hypothetical protein [unclassified Thioalkalivibrio]
MEQKSRSPDPSASRPRQVLCMKWGTMYGPEYVNRLYASVRRQVSGPLRFVCLTDDSEGIREEIETHPCPEIEIPEPWRNTTWRKMALYLEPASLSGLEGEWLFLDLDVVVTGRLDPLFDYEADHPFVVMQNWTQRGKGIGNTSVFRFRMNTHGYLLERLLDDFPHYLERYRNEQTFISREIDSLQFWPDAWCVLFKVHCVPAWPMRLWRTPAIPEGARVVAFPGSPNPPDALQGKWPEKRWRKRLYKKIRPASWIDTYWTRSEELLAQESRESTED